LAVSDQPDRPRAKSQGVVDPIGSGPDTHVVTRPRLVVVLLGVVVAACASASGIRPPEGAETTSTSRPTTTTTTPASPGGGTVVVGIGEDAAPRTLNPFLDGPDTSVLDLLSPALFARGYDIDPTTFELVPNVLAAIPSVDDGTVIDLGDGTIRVTETVATGARWADGVPITGDDLAFTVETASDPSLAIRADLARRYSLVVPGSLQPDGRTVTFVMAASAEYELLFDLIIPRHSVEGSDFGEDWNATPWVSGGPFTVASGLPGQTLELTRNQSYWRRGPDDEPLPLLDRVVVRFYEPGPEPDPRMIEGFRSGEIDVATLADATASTDDYQAVDGAAVLTGNGLTWTYLNFQFGPANRNDMSLNRHLDFRRAIAESIDRSALAGSVGGRPLESALGLYGPTFEATPWDRYPFDPGDAGALMQGLGSDLGIDVSAGSGRLIMVTVPDDDPGVAALAGQVVTMLRTGGFDAQLQLEDASTFYGPTTDNGTWDVSIGRFTAGPGVARAVALAEIFDPAGLPFIGDNYFRWGTIDSTVTGDAVDEYAALVDDLRATFDPAAAAVLVRRAEEILADQAVIVPLVADGNPGIAFRPGTLGGPALNVAEGALWNIASWTRQGTSG
jgi:ABC-type transport system substrate-binding protein